ncbi:MAG: DUF2812 domain-containing protein [Defluviitaleaceae bacterium]|nr:DUF2812 domain-containing protein [Defluviitaleaceae bacterium]
MKREFYLGLTGGIKYLEERFAQMAEKGWMIDSLGVFFLRYKKAEPCKKKFFVDVLPEIGTFDYPHNDDAMTHRAFCEEKGWEYVTSEKYWRVFSADADSETSPVHTDHCLQNKIYMRTYLKFECMSVVLSFICMVIMFFMFSRIGPEILLSDMMVFLLLGVVGVFFALFLFVVVGFVWCLRTWGAYRRGLPPVFVSSFTYRVINAVFSFSALMFPVFVGVGIFFEVRGGVPLAIVVFAFSFLAIGWGVGLWLRNRVNTVESERSTNIAKFIGTMIGIGVLVSVVMGIVVGRLPMPPIHGRYVAVDDRPAITAYALGLPLMKPSLFEARTSIAVPVNYVYREAFASTGITTRVRQTAHPIIARSFFNHTIEDRMYWDERIGREFSHRRLNSEASAAWDADEGFVIYSGQEMQLILRRGRTELVFFTNLAIDLEILQQEVISLWGLV